MSTTVILNEPLRRGLSVEPAEKALVLPDHVADILIRDGKARRPGVRAKASAPPPPDPNKAAEPPKTKEAAPIESDEGQSRPVKVRVKGRKG